jgi:hypothetical protein
MLGPQAHGEGWTHLRLSSLVTRAEAGGGFAVLLAAAAVRHIDHIQLALGPLAAPLGRLRGHTHWLSARRLREMD